MEAAVLCQKVLEPARATGQSESSCHRMDFKGRLLSMETVVQDTLFELPAPVEAATPKTAAGRAAAWAKAGEAVGGLLPQHLLPEILGLSKQRVTQLIQDDRFECVMLFGYRFITGDSLGKFVELERKSGHKLNPASGLKLAKISMEMGRFVAGTNGQK